MSQKSFSLGIDLGTSNSAACLNDLSGGQSHIVEMSQILGPGSLGERPTLPSALYIPHATEFPADQLRLPWETDAPDEDQPAHIIGQFARQHGAMVPDRLVTSAKSWLSNAHVDPRAALLPWGSTLAEGNLSAFECSRLYLNHLRQGLLHAEARKGRQRDLDQAQIVITVPASFDELARHLTLEAAEAAGFAEVMLLEEPQAAFYAWVEQAGAAWREQVAAGDIILVCDVGGGTADFSLIAVSEQQGNLELERISVGEHILLGGDNMDLALAYTLQAKLEAEGTTIDDWQFLALVQAASQAKVSLFSDPSLQTAPIAVPSRGSSLLAGTVSTELHRPELDAVVLDGFFALTEVTDLPSGEPNSALQEFGLPYASDPVISKQLAAFLSRSLRNVRASETLSALVKDRPDCLRDTHLQPTAVLFNGGVFKADPLRQRILDLLNAWAPASQPVRELAGFQPDLAVAKGAAFHGGNRLTGQGLRIKAGTARSYYIGLESARPAVPGFKPPLRALCVVPQGMEEGSTHTITGKTFGLVTGKPAEFRFFASSVRSGDQPGSIVPNAETELEETAKLEINLPPMEAFADGHPIPVQLESVVTDLGNLELWMRHTASDERWKVEFKVRME